MKNIILIGDSINPTGPAQIRLRIRYRDVVMPWWPQRNIAADEVPAPPSGTTRCVTAG